MPALTGAPPKIVIACWGGPADRAARRALFVERLGPAFVEDGAARVQLDVADEHSDVPSPNPLSPSGPSPIALVSLWIADPDPALARLRDAGLDVHAWRVAHDVYTDYGEHPARGPRDWPDGTRSPTIASINFLERPASIDLETWIERWHGRMSPVSAELQPRVRYVRNLLLEPLTEGAPGWQAIVEEVWPSPEHVRRPSLFYGARSPLAIARHMARILSAVSSFLRPWRVRVVMMSEYFVHTTAEGVPREPRADGPPRERNAARAT